MPKRTDNQTDMRPRTLRIRAAVARKTPRFDALALSKSGGLKF